MTMELHKKTIHQSYLYINYFKLHFFHQIYKIKMAATKNDVFLQNIFFVAKNKMLVSKPTFLRSLIAMKSKAQV